MVKKNLRNTAAAAILALTLVSCTEPLDIERETISSRQAIELMAQGERYEKEGNYRMALDKYNKALDLAQSPRVYYRIGSCYFGMGDYARAKEYLAVAEQLAGDFPEASYLLSRTRTQMALAAARSGQQPIPAPALPTPPPAIGAPSKTPKPISPEVAVSSTSLPRPEVVRQPTAVSPIPTSPYAKVFAPTPSRPTEPVAVATQPTLQPTPKPTDVTPRQPLPRPEEVAPAALPAAKPAVVSTPKPTVSTIERPTSPAPDLTTTTPPPSVSLVTPTPPTPFVSPAVTTPTVAKKPERVEAPIELPLEKIFPKPTATEAPSTGPVAGPALLGPTTTSAPLLTDWRFHWQQALSFIERKQNEDAVSELQLVLGAQPTHLDARLELADCYDRLGQGQKALEQCEKARMFHPVNPKPYFRTGNYYLRHAEENPTYYDRARDFYFQAVHHDSQYYFAHHNVAVTYMKQGDYERARQWFVRALKVKPDYGTARRNLGLLYELHLNDREAAMREYREYLRLGGPDAKEVADWLRALEEAGK